MQQAITYKNRKSIYRLFYHTLLFLVSWPDGYAEAPHSSTIPHFSIGERLSYEAHFNAGLISSGSIGNLTTTVDEQSHELNGYTCYKLQIEGTSNTFLGKINNQWESYIDVHLLRPHKYLAEIKDGDYTKKEQIDYNYKSNTISMKIAESSKQMMQKVTHYPISNENPLQDLVTAYYALRSIDITQLKPGDKFIVPLLHEQLHDNLPILFLGTKTITTKLGKIQTIALVPVVSLEGTIFAGENPIEILLSNDLNKVPIKLQLNLIFGSVTIELTDYNGLKHPIPFQKP